MRYLSANMLAIKLTAQIVTNLSLMLHIEGFRSMLFMYYMANSDYLSDFQIARLKGFKICINRDLAINTPLSCLVIRPIAIFKQRTYKN